MAQGEKILVIGASGLVGRALCAALSPDRYLPTYFRHPVDGGVRFDITRDDVARLLAGGASFTHGVILSAESKIDPCVSDPQGTRLLNVDAPARIARQLLAHGIKPVFFSSEYVFDGRKGNYSERDTPTPNTAYGKQKLAAEQALKELGGCLVLRLAKTLGMEPDDGSLLTAAMRQLTRGERIRAAHDQIFSPLSAADAAGLILRAVEADLSGVYHLGGAKSWSRYDLTMLLAKTWGGEASIEACSLDDIKLPDARPKNVSMDSSHLYAATGLRPNSMESFCEEVVARYRR